MQPINSRGSSQSLPIYKRKLSRCLCHGTLPSIAPFTDSLSRRTVNDDKTHPVWIAVLEEDNDMWDRERSMEDYLCCSMNRLVVWWSGRPFIHCQIVFWNAVEKKYYTYSVDTKRGVWAYDEKEFQRGWRFVRIMVTERAELAMHNFLVDQLGKPMNTLGQYMAWTWFPASGNEARWFCSELMTRALVEGGIIKDDDVVPEAMAPHSLYNYLLEQCAYLPRPVLQQANPISLLNFHRELEQHSDELVLIIPAAGIGQSVASALEERKNSGGGSSRSSSSSRRAAASTTLWADVKGVAPSRANTQQSRINMV